MYLYHGVECIFPVNRRLCDGPLRVGLLGRHDCKRIKLSELRRIKYTNFISAFIISTHSKGLGDNTFLTVFFLYGPIGEVSNGP